MLEKVKGYHAAYAVLVIVIFGLVLRLTWLLWPYDVMHVTGPLRIVTRHVVGGEQLLYEMDYCQNWRYETLDARIEHSFVDGLIHNAPSVYGHLASGCHTVMMSIPMPRLPPGRYYLEMRRFYQVNPARAVLVEARSPMFHVYDEGHR